VLELAQEHVISPGPDPREPLAFGCRLLRPLQAYPRNGRGGVAPIQAAVYARPPIVGKLADVQGLAEEPAGNIAAFQVEPGLLAGEGIDEAVDLQLAGDDVVAALHPHAGGIRGPGLAGKAQLGDGVGVGLEIDAEVGFLLVV